MPDLVPIRRALVSVSDKTDLIPFARRLAAHGVVIISTGGTAKAIEQAGIPVTAIDQVTRFPEMMDGRVKTLHPRVHGGLLALRDNAEHVRAMKEHGIEAIDLVCVNLYPFEKTIAKPDVADHEAIEQIDIGGPSMIRSGSKNFGFVTVVTDPSQYDGVCNDMDAHGGATTHDLRKRLAAAAFGRTAAYDTAISRWMQDRLAQSSGSELFPNPLLLRYSRVAELRYGENPHQAAAVYADPTCPEPGVVSARQLHGKELSYNNLNDAAAALELVKEFVAPAAAVIKHTNPCGCGVAGTVAQAFESAYSGDPLAAFGGIVAFNRNVDRATAESLTAGQKFLEVIVAPDYEPDALEMLRERWKNVRLLAVGTLPRPHERVSRLAEYRSVVGGLLAQQRDLADMSPDKWKHTAGPEPSRAQLDDLHLAWCAVKHVKSNAVTLVRDGCLVGAGAGQMDRVESCKIAIAKANAKGENRSQNAVAASDAFFPFRDGPDLLIAAGVKAIVQPGGSKRDDETIAACDAAGVSMMFTGNRHFRH
ncbi:MAG: bifunctional phosphoribosylaminoimidazolecarboxamide formyltransferase/IMP cyclohydrolase [Planctomycetes bacterium]|nr:bifunctional phosphoribosylaminoimidazolecarboxamide formyltransferase/IMP cyclohydrolase [Planctomycetota bacterium]